jgi:DNA-binding transcriptional LysR family regulator
MPETLHWDDLRIVAAVRDSGTYMGAGRRLRINETTVARRLTRLQGALGVKLFDAVDGVRVPTAACVSVLASVDAMTAHAAAITHLKAASTHAGIAAKFRIATTNALAEEVLAPALPTLLHQHPGLTVHLLTSSANVNFSRWEADIAIRLKKPERGDFTISRLATVPLYLFEPVNPLPDGTSTERRPPTICAYPDDLDDTPETKYLIAQNLKANARCISANGHVIRRMVQSHTAIGILPAFLCADLLSDSGFRVTKLPQPREVWLLVQDHLKRDTSARTMIDWIKTCFAATVAG